MLHVIRYLQADTHHASRRGPFVMKLPSQPGVSEGMIPDVLTQHIRRRALCDYGIG